VLEQTTGHGKPDKGKGFGFRRRQTALVGRQGGGAATPENLSSTATALLVSNERARGGKKARFAAARPVLFGYGSGWRTSGGASTGRFWGFFGLWVGFCGFLSPGPCCEPQPDPTKQGPAIVKHGWVGHGGPLLDGPAAGHRAGVGRVRNEVVLSTAAEMDQHGRQARCGQGGGKPCGCQPGSSRVTVVRVFFGLNAATTSGPGRAEKAGQASSRAPAFRVEPARARRGVRLIRSAGAVVCPAPSSAGACCAGKEGGR